MRAAAARQTKRRYRRAVFASSCPCDAGSLAAYHRARVRHGRLPVEEPTDSVRRQKNFACSRYWYAAGGAREGFIAQSVRELRWFCARWPRSSLDARTRTIGKFHTTEPTRDKMHRWLHSVASHRELVLAYTEVFDDIEDTCAICNRFLKTPRDRYV
jgi:hypothetical protein